MDKNAAASCQSGKFDAPLDGIICMLMARSQACFGESKTGSAVGKINRNRPVGFAGRWKGVQL